MKPARFIGWSSCLFLGLAVAFGAEEKPGLIIESLAPDGRLQYHLETGAATSTNGVRVRYGEAQLTAREIRIDDRTGTVIARGAVQLQHAQLIWRGEQLEYNFTTRDLKTDRFRISYAPFQAAGQSAARLALVDTNPVYVATNAFVTTDDSATPGYRVRTRRLKVVPGEYIEARNAVVYVGKVPLFYFPYYRRSLGRHPNHWVITPGYRSLYGPYLHSAYHWYLSTNLEGAVHLDYRLKRGAGFGPDFQYDLGELGAGSLRYYYTHDLDPGRDPAGERIRDDRYRLSFTHQAALASNLTAKVVLRKQSDLFVIRDFFESEYRTNIQPSSFVELNPFWSNFSLNVVAQPRINDFFETVERLPDVKLSAARQQLGESPFFYEGETSAGYFRRRFADDRTNDFAAFRADTFHQLLWPNTFFGWLNLTPRIGGRVTRYTEAHGRGAQTDEETRGVFNTGAELSFKASRVWRGARSRFWAVNELRHIVEPSLNYVYVPRPTVRPMDLPQFDYELQSFRLLPIVYPDYNSIDSIDSQNVLRLSLRNKLQTKRTDGVENLVNWALYTDWRLKTRRGQGSFADLFSDLDLKPRSWLTINSEVRFDLEHRRWREVNHKITILPNNVWSLELGHRYLRDDLATYGLGNNLITSSLFYRLNENWAARISHHFEARDGRMEEQYYTLYRDLRSWTAALTFRIRDSRRGPTDFGVAITFSLKAFPRFGLGDDSERPSLLLGG